MTTKTTLTYHLTQLSADSLAERADGGTDIKFRTANTCLVISLIGKIVANIKELKAKFDRLPVTPENYKLYEALLDLDRTVFVPLMEEIIEGRLDIEDTRPLVSSSLMIEELPVSEERLPILQTGEDLKKNVAARLFDPTNYIREVQIEDFSVDGEREAALDAFEERTGIRLTPAQRSAFLASKPRMNRVDVSTSNKDLQIRLTNRLSPDPARKI